MNQVTKYYTRYAETNDEARLEDTLECIGLRRARARVDKLLNIFKGTWDDASVEVVDEIDKREHP